MSDVVPNYDLERQGMELEKSQLMLNVQSQTFRIAQMNDEETKIRFNITATLAAVSELDKRIKNLDNKDIT
jgi:hypothetical protein